MQSTKEFDRWLKSERPQDIFNLEWNKEGGRNIDRYNTVSLFKRKWRWQCFLCCSVSRWAVFSRMTLHAESSNPYWFQYMLTSMKEPEEGHFAVLFLPHQAVCGRSTRACWSQAVYIYSEAGYGSPWRSPKDVYQCKALSYRASFPPGWNILSSVE